MGINLSPQQETAYDKIGQWLKEDNQEFVLAGYAGTGKSTIASAITDTFDTETAYCAYTGKAANVLREKGCYNANTLHGWLYNPKGQNKERLQDLQTLHHQAVKQSDHEEARKIMAEIDRLQEELKQPAFALNESSMLKQYELVIVDEYSMLDDKILNDLRQVANKILYLGDPYQLPPVKGECSLQPEYFLDEIHRQAMDSAIIRYSQEVRNGNYIPYGDHGDLKHLKRNEVDKSVLTGADQIICGRNLTKNSINAWCRQQLGYTNMYPQTGDKMICLKNNHEAGLFNGLIGNVTKGARPCGDVFYYMNFDGMEDMKVFAPDIFGLGSKFDHNNKTHRELERFDFGYAITCHKSQGSEFENVAIINEPVGSGDQRQRWLYTGITRAKEQCYLLQPGSKKR